MGDDLEFTRNEAFKPDQKAAQTHIGNTLQIQRSKMKKALLPRWVPDAAEHYLQHTETGLSIRAVARLAGCHPSTVLRQIRRFETRRDDVLVDRALTRLGKTYFAPRAVEGSEVGQRDLPRRNAKITTEDHQLRAEALRVLRRLCETGATLVVACNLEKAVVLRDLPGGQSTRTAVVDRVIAESMALKAWISCVKNGKASLYEVTPAGRTFVKSGIDPRGAALMEHGFSEASATFEGAKPADFSAHEDVDTRRFTTTESPLLTLARRRDKSGAPFLEDTLVAAGERFREDFELAQMGLEGTQIWQEYLREIKSGVAPMTPLLPDEKQRAAHDRTRDALRDLGLGLGDAVLRCCCFLEGLETTEKEMDWAARSGKIVLKIALQRLSFHYFKTYGKHGPMIG
jgi:hypothetical protein